MRKANMLWNSLLCAQAVLGSTFSSLALIGCGNGGASAADPEKDQPTGEIEANLTQIPSNVLCVQITVSRGQTSTFFTVAAGQSSAALDIGRLPMGTTEVQAAAFSVACSSVTASTVPDWVSAPVSVEVKPGIKPQVRFVLVPNVTTTVGVDFIQPPIALAAGGLSAFAIGSTGAVRAWGNNTGGILGDGTSTTRLAPVAASLLGPPADFTAAIAVSSKSGASHACSLTTMGGLRCWGANGSGQLGNGTTTPASNPIALNNSDTLKVALGDNHTCIIMSDTTFRCAGSNTSGQLGVNSTVPSFLYFASSATTGYIDIAAGGDTTCARRDGLNSGVYCWGSNAYGQCGTEPTGTNQLSPVLVVGMGAAAEIDVGDQFACGRKSDGTVWCWGSNASGQLGDLTTVDRSSPVQVQGISSAVQISLGRFHACALLADGSVRCWGANGWGQLGDGSGVGQLTPVPVRGIAGALEVRAGGNFTCVRLESGTAQCFGYNREGEVGDGTTEPRFVPTPVAW
jgi:alpha-tubulin suppressor-like RCC1 family protein